MTAIRRLGAVLALVAGAVFLASGPAAAHTKLVSTSPGSEATLSSAPGSVSLTFDEAVAEEGATVLVTAPDGAGVTSGPVRVAGAVVSVPLKPLTATGAYQVAWRVVSDDGHPVAGQWRFTVVALGSAATPAAAFAAEPAAQAGPAGDPPSNWWGTHLLHLIIGVGIVGVGGWLMLVLTRPPKARRGPA